MLRRVFRPSEAEKTYWGLEITVRQCLATRDPAKAKRVHGEIAAKGLDQDRYLGNLLVEMYGKCARVDDAVAAFHRISLRNVFSWNNLFTALGRNGQEREALEYFARMQQLGEKPDRISFVVLLDCCASCKDRRLGQQIHGFIDEGAIQVANSHISLKNALIHMYASCGSLIQAKKIFDAVPDKDVVTWSSMIAAFAQNGQYHQALAMLKAMDLIGEKPTFVTHISLLEACSRIGSYQMGVMIHRRILDAGLESELNLGNAIVSAYGKLGDIASAETVFERMERRNLVSWNVMIAANAQNGRSQQALKLFQRLDLEGLKPCRVTFLGVLEACAGFSSQDHSEFLHSRVEAAGFVSDTVMANALLNTHGKCGSLARARDVFDRMPRRSDLSWSTMIDAYAQRGRSSEALELFAAMVVEGFRPSDVTFISVLCACSHAGLARKAWDYFASMLHDFWIDPVAEHYGCLIDLFGRVGWLDAAFSSAAAIHGNPVAWIMLLAACKTHGDEDRGSEAARRVVELDPEAQTGYVLLSNMYTT